MNRRTKNVLLIGGLAVAAVFVTYGALTAAFARVVDPSNYCETGFSALSSCTLHWTRRTTHQSTPIFTIPLSATSTSPSPLPDTVDVTSWALAECPENPIARRLLCATGSVASAASDDLATGLPRPKPWVITMAKNSPFIEAVHVETPLGLAAVLGFYRAALSKRGWTEDDGAVVAPETAAIAFTTADGPALLRLTRQNGKTAADLSRRKPAAKNAAKNADTNASILPQSGQAKLMLGNTMDEEAVITIDEQAVTLAARAGDNLWRDPDTGSSPDSRDINLPPGKYKVTVKSAEGAAQTGQLQVAAGETWGLLAGPDGVPLPVRLY